MADSLFDNRYRYDYIYPRGRSGETLRAVDTQASNRAVAVKRPAPSDAPPIRAGQEVSILNERKALTRLAGHPVLTALLNTGQFSVGGTLHQYIVVERAEGENLADLVRELAAHGERLPELEMLVIAEGLLDLLEAAHAADIVYNDVDAKHLFWDRERYRLKLIDWGNAVFLEGDDSTPQGVSRQSDIAQVGGLLYMILTGGARAEIPRDAADDFRLSFGDDAARVHTRLQAIVSKAAHPNPRARYRSIAELRRELAEYRAPLVRERDTVLNRVTERLRRNRSRDELYGLLDTLRPALAQDPGYPAARALETEIHNRLQDIEVAADLDAVRIYLESANWQRSVSLLDELLGRVRGDSARLVNLLHDLARALLEANVQPTPLPVLDSIGLLFDGHPERAAHILVTETADDDERDLQWGLAERISAHVPEIHLLRPNLLRLDKALARLAAEGLPVTEPRAVLAEINARLDDMPADDTVSMVALRDGYRAVVDGLTALSTLLDAVSGGHNLAEHRLPLSALERALNAAMALADNMHVIGRQAAASPRDALAALDASRAIDPTSLSWDAVAGLLDRLYATLGAYQTYVPAADGSDLEAWLHSARATLLPFTERLFDEMLVGMAEGLEIAAHAWGSYANVTVQGSRLGALNALTQATDAVGTVSPTLAGWFNHLRAVITSAQYVERHALYGGLGRALADGWEAYDRGRLADAEQLGQRAYEIARSDTQRLAAGRLHRLAEMTRVWLDRGAVNDAETCKAALVSVERMYTVDENTTRENFTRQMPSKDTYLRAMGKGLVELYARGGTAAVRILFFNYILLGALDAHAAETDDAEFWLAAAGRALEPFGANHPTARALDDLIRRRRDINSAAAQLNSVTGAEALPRLETLARALDENPQARTLAAGAFSLRELQASLRDWSDGEFRPAGIKLENAINAVSEVEQAAGVTLTAYRAELMSLQAGAAELHTRARHMAQAVEERPAEPPPALLEGHRHLLNVTHRLLGEAYTGTLRQWRDTYEAFVSVYTDATMRRSARLSRFNELFRVMFIDRHPAYALYRHWYDLTEQAPEFPAPPTSEPVPRLDEAAAVAESDYRGARYADPAPEPPAAARPRLPRRLLLLAPVALAGIIALALLAGRGGGPPAISVTITDTPAGQAVAQDATAAAPPTTTDAPPSDTPPPATATEPAAAPPGPSSTPSETATPADTPTATLTLTATPSPTPSSTPTITPTPTATLPAGGLTGRQDLLALFDRLPAYPWSSEQFSRGVDGTYWRLGVGAGTDTGQIVVTVPPETLETYYGGGAAGRISSLEATLALTSYNPPLVLDGAVYYGVALVGDGGAAQGLRVQLVQPGVINLGQVTNGEALTVSQRAVNNQIARLRLNRDPGSGTITCFFNDEQIGPPLTGVGASVSPALFVYASGVIVSVTEWTITLR